MPWELLLLQPKLFSSTCRTKLMAWSGVAIEGKDLIHGKAAFCHALPFWPTWEDQDPFPWVVSPLPCHAVCLLHSLCRPSGNMAGSIVGNTWVRSGYRHNAQTPPQSRLCSFLPRQTNVSHWAYGKMSTQLCQLHCSAASQILCVWCWNYSNLTEWD